MIIVKKIILVAEPGPEPAERGTFLTVEPTAESPTYGFYAGTLAADSGSVTVDWGDGTVETVADISRMAHTYAVPGVYTVRLSDDLAMLGCSAPVGTAVQSKVYAKLLKGVVCNAAKLKTLNAGAFRQSDNLVSADFADAAIATLKSNVFNGCAALAGAVVFPAVVDIDGAAGTQPFAGCAALREIHFARANEPVITALPCYADDPHLGAANATVLFDK